MKTPIFYQPSLLRTQLHPTREILLGRGNITSVKESAKETVLFQATRSYHSGESVVASVDVRSVKKSVTEPFIVDTKRDEALPMPSESQFPSEDTQAVFNNSHSSSEGFPQQDYGAAQVSSRGGAKEIVTASLLGTQGELPQTTSLENAPNQSLVSSPTNAATSFFSQSGLHSIATSATSFLSGSAWHGRMPRWRGLHWRGVSRLALTVVMIITFTISAAIIVPELYYTLFANSAVEDVAELAQLYTSEEEKTQERQPYMPPQNPELPTGTWVSIPRIGVYSELIASENPTEALDRGTWLVPDFGRPGDYSQPTIVAAHRFGWDWWWKSDYWKYNSFYLLTETQPGDRVEVVYDQRKWVYEIYAGEEGELITDYSADLILYTCKYLNSPVRYFRYARVVEV